MAQQKSSIRKNEFRSHSKSRAVIYANNKTITHNHQTYQQPQPQAYFHNHNQYQYQYRENAVHVQPRYLLPVLIDCKVRQVPIPILVSTSSGCNVDDEKALSFQNGNYGDRGNGYKNGYGGGNGSTQSGNGCNNGYCSAFGVCGVGNKNNNKNGGGCDDDDSSDEVRFNLSKNGYCSAFGVGGVGNNNHNNNVGVCDDDDSNDEVHVSISKKAQYEKQKCSRVSEKELLLQFLEQDCDDVDDMDVDMSSDNNNNPSDQDF